MQWQLLNDTYSCFATIKNDDGTTNILQLTGSNTHVIGKSNADVQMLVVWNQNASRIPSNLNQYFPNLIAIRFVNSQVPMTKLINFENSGSNWIKILTYTPLLKYLHQNFQLSDRTFAYEFD